MVDLAPVLIITLNRYAHFKRCIESLSECTHANETNLYIAFDYPANETHWDGYKKIEAYLPNIDAFKNVNIIKRTENYGIPKNYFEAEKEIFKTHDRLIVSEDDNTFSPNFLYYINKGLECYRNNDNIFAICGYNYPIRMVSEKNEDVYFWKGIAGWGYGIWRSKNELVDWNIENLKNYLNDKKNINKLNRIGEHIYPLLKRTIETQRIYGDAMISYHLVKNNLYSVFPKISLVRNMGNDGSGENCSLNKIYTTQKIDDGNKEICFPTIIQGDRRINKLLNRNFSRSYYARVRRKIKIIIKNNFS